MIEQKYKLMQEVWVINENKVETWKVVKVYLSSSSSLNATYSIKLIYWVIDRNENEIFDTKESLIASL